MTGPCKLLVLDDEADIVEELTEFLNAEGFDCIGETSPLRARERLADDEDIGLLLIDLRMPEKDGLSFIRDLGEFLPDGRPLEVVIFTGHGGEDELIQALRLGVADYLRKPVDLDELVEIAGRLQQSYFEQKQRLAMDSGFFSRLEELATAIESINQRMENLNGRSTLGAAMDVESGHAGSSIPEDLRLTPRQKEVLSLVARGMNNFQIACELDMSESTVKLHVSRILRATGLYNRTQLALAYEKWHRGG
ncbi:response regulator transcription factor [Methylonatrum kenyense]|uniref:response regulator transcription factor n=1 Tax=Methylonatrum kenyense TaxID=455253 RepID=UPI0020BFD68A|nr:response regulator transcription factor [Methylonatrum kenyense]MCK8515216.1 response regulator transcription factor [Methylonatrum kenyense]